MGASGAVPNRAGDAAQVGGRVSLACSKPGPDGSVSSVNKLGVVVYAYNPSI